MTITTASFPARGASNPDTRTGGREDISLDLQAQISQLANSGDADDSFTSLNTVANIDFTSGQIARYNVISFTTASKTVKAPDMADAGTTSSIEGRYYVFYNPGSNSYNVIDQASNVLATAPAGGYAYLFLRDNSTANGTWDQFTVDVFGGSTETSSATSITLVAGSTRLQSVAFTAADQTVTLPDATTLDEGALLYEIENAGSREFDILSSGGGYVVSLAPGHVASLSLRDNATAAGEWVVSGSYMTFRFVDATVVDTVGSDYAACCRLSDSLLLVAYDDKSTTDNGIVNVIDYSGTPATGTAATFETGAAIDIELHRISDTQAFLSWGDSGGSTFKVAVVTVTGTTCAVGTPATISSTANAATEHSSTLVSPTLAFVTYGETTSDIRARTVTISGTTVTANTAITYNAGNMVEQHCAALDATYVISVSRISSTVYANLFSISGTTVTEEDEETASSSDSITACFSINSTDVVVTGRAISDQQIVYTIGRSSTSISFKNSVTIFAGDSDAAQIGTVIGTNHIACFYYSTGGYDQRGNMLQKIDYGYEYLKTDTLVGATDNGYGFLIGDNDIDTTKLNNNELVVFSGDVNNSSYPTVLRFKYHV